MAEHRAKMREDGRVVIPAIYRKALHLEPGEEFILRIENSGLYLISLKQALEKAQLLVQRHAKQHSLVDTLRSLRDEDE